MNSLFKHVMIEKLEEICQSLTYERNKNIGVHYYLKIDEAHMDRVRNLYHKEDFVLYNDEICRLVLQTAVKSKKTVNELMALDDEKLFDILFFNTARAIMDSTLIFELSKHEDDIEAFTKRSLMFYDSSLKDVKIHRFDDYEQKLVDRLIEIYGDKGIKIYEAEAFAVWENYSGIEYHTSFLLYDRYSDEELFKATIPYILGTVIELKYDDRINLNFED